MMGSSGVPADGSLVRSRRGEAEGRGVVGKRLGAAIFGSAAYSAGRVAVVAAAVGRTGGVARPEPAAPRARRAGPFTVRCGTR